MTFDAVRLIEAKRDGDEVAADDLAALVAAYVADEVADSQMAAFFMAGVLRGFTDAEAVALCDAYVASGEVIDLSMLDGPTVDKHSTGGVADTTTFVVGPIVAACGLQLAKLSGRGLGHTGGTLDKLEAIPGLRVDLTPKQVADQVQNIGLAVVAATAELAPADKRTYALRDVTGTVASQALIAASIMSKKIAGGAEHIVLDVKTGDGAFLTSQEEAAGLAALCVRIGQAKGRKVSALMTDMSQPLGPAIGNALEVVAAIDALTPAAGESAGVTALREVSVALAMQLLRSTGRADAEQAVQQALDSGAARERLGDMVQAQGGDRHAVDDPYTVLPRAPEARAVVAGRSGVVGKIACQHLGEVAVRLGAGRLRAGQPVDPAVGITLDRRVGDRVEAGERLAVVHARTPADADRAAIAVKAAFVVGESAAATAPVLRVIGA